MSVSEWQHAYEQGELTRALELARAAPENNIDALQWRVLAAFRVGEMAECADTALRLVPSNATSAGLPADWDGVLAASVVASGELMRFDQALAHLHGMLSMAKRAGDLNSYVRARGTAANCFALMGDPWAGQRLLAELAGFFMGAPQERALEATVRGNLCATYLLIAQWARRVGDTTTLHDAADHAQTNVERCRELGSLLDAPRVHAFADVHSAELAILRGQPAKALQVLPDAIEGASKAGLLAHLRHLRLTQAEAALDADELALARASLQAMAQHIGEAHEISSRIRHHRAWKRVHAIGGVDAAALQHADAAWDLQQQRNYAQLQAQSRYLRTRLELEHLYRYRSSRSSSAPTTSPGELL
jgi:hypothetical protein